MIVTAKNGKFQTQRNIHRYHLRAAFLCIARLPLRRSVLLVLLRAEALCLSTSSGSVHFL